MSVIWTWQSQEWRPEPLSGTAAELTPARILPAKTGFVLVAPPGRRVSVNGEPLSLGIRFLRDRDEIAIESPDAEHEGLRRHFYSSERLASVEPLPASDRAVMCPRCKQPIVAGRPAVRCPNPQCGLWHHEDTEKELNCWTFASHCAMCDQPTPLDAGYRWTPNVL